MKNDGYRRRSLFPGVHAAFHETPIQQLGIFLAAASMERAVVIWVLHFTCRKNAD